MSQRGPEKTVVLDLDGTLVDSVYVHTLAWQSAFADLGLQVPAHRLHRLIGMGGDRLVTAATAPSVEHSVGDEVRARHRIRLDELFDRIVPTEGALRLLETLAAHRLTVVLASSGDADLTTRLLDLLEGNHLLEDRITGSDAERSKPSGELVEVALSSVDADHAVVVGDATWDLYAARDAGVPGIGLLTGGFAEAELREAGAVAVHLSPAALADHLDQHGRLI